MWKIPLIELDIGEEEIKAVNKVLNSKWLTIGEITERFEEEFGERLGAKYSVTVSNCTSALHLALRILDIKRGDEVICPSLTFVATANAVLYVGAKPVFADINSFEDLTISPEDIERKITKKTKAIIVVHYGGYACKMDEIMKIAENYKLKVIEDCAHSPLGEYKGKKLGTIGDIGCFSFFSNKNMTTGEGGMLVTNNSEYAKKAKYLRSHGMTSLTFDRYKGHAFSYDVVDLGYNYRIDEIRSAIGLVQLKKLEKNNKKREKIVKTYIKLLKDEESIIIPFKDFNRGKSSYHLFPIILKNSNREKFMEELKKKGIQTSIHYLPVHLFSYYQKLGYKKGLLPLTEKVAEGEITLPLFPKITPEQIDYLTSVVKKCIRNA